MPTAGDFSLHVIGQAQGFEQMGSQINQLATVIDTTGSSIQRFGSTTSSLSSGFSSVTTGTDQMTAGFTRSNDALGQFGQSTSTFSSTLNTMGSGFATAGQSVTQFSQGLQQGQASVGEFSSGIGQLNQAVSQSATPLNQFGQSVQTLESDLTGVGAGVAGVDQSLNGLATGGLTSANTGAQGLGETFDMNTGIFQNFDNQQKSTFSTMKSGFAATQQLASGFAQAAGSITGLIFSAYSLEKAQFAVHKVETTLEATRQKLDKQTAKLADTIQKYGQDSEEASRGAEALALTEQRLADLQERAGLVQENYNHQLMAFATTTGPLVVSTVSGIAQGITSMADVFGVGMDKVAKFAGEFGPLGIAIAAVVIGMANWVSSIMDAIKAQENLATALKTNDVGKIVLAQLDATIAGVESVRQSPGAGGIFTIIDKLMGEPAEVASKIKETFTTYTDAYNKSQSEWVAQISTLPPGIESGITAKMEHLKALLDPKNFAVNVMDPKTKQFSQAYFDTWKASIITGYDDIGNAITEGQKKVIAITAGGTIDEREKMLGVGAFADPAVFAKGEALLKGHYTNAALIAEEFNKRKLADQGLTWENFLAIERSQGVNWDKTETELAKKMLDDKDKANEDEDKLNKENLKNDLAFAKMKADNRGKAIEAENKANEERLKGDLAFAKQQAEIESQNVEAWKQRTGMITEETKLIADMDHERKMHTDTLTKQYQQEAMQLTGLNNLTGLRIDQIAELALTQEKHTKIIRDANVELMHMADAAGIDATKWIEFKAAGDDSIDTVQSLNDQLEILINTSTDYLQMILAPTQEQLNAVNMAYTKGVVSVKSYVEQQFLLQHQQAGVSDGMAKAISLGGLWNGALGTIVENLKLTDPQMKLLIDDFIKTGNTAQATAAIMEQTFGEALKILDPAITAKKIKDVDNELKKVEGFKDFSSGFKKAMIGVTEDMNRTQKVSVEFGNDIKFMLDGISSGISSKNIKSGFKELTNDLDDLVKKSPAKGTLDPVLNYLKELSGPEIMKELPNLAPALNELNDALAAPKEEQLTKVQAVIAKYPEIFKQMGVDVGPATTGIGGLTGKITELGDATKTTAEKYKALNDAIVKSGTLHIIAPQFLGDQPITKDGKQVGSTGEQVEGGGKDTKKTGDDFGLSAMQKADAMAKTLNADMNKYVIAGMNLVGNKSSELLKVMGGNFDKLETSVNQSQQSMNKVMNTYMINGMNLTGNKSVQLNTVMGKAFDTLEKTVMTDSQAMNKAMNAQLIAGMNVTGNKSAEFDNVMSHNFSDLASHVKQSTANIRSSIDGMTGAMQLAESQAKSLATAIGNLKSKDITITTHFKTTGSPSSGGNIQNVAKGGVYWANQAKTMTFGEAGNELAIFLPLREKGEVRRGDFDVTIPQPTPDLSGIKQAVSSALQPRNAKDLIGHAGAGASRAITIVLNTAEKVMLNERELIEIIRQKVFKHVINEMG